MIQTIVFDAWGTLAESSAKPSPFREINTLLGKSFDDYAYLYAFEQCAALDSLGNVREIASRLLDRFGIGLNIKGRAHLEASLERAFTGPIQIYDDVKAVLSSLRRSYRLGLLSNSGALSAGNLRSRFPVDEFFRGVLFSYEVQRLKPDAAIFKAVLNRLGGTPPDKALYVGDHPISDYRGALNAGMEAILLDRKGRYRASGLRRISNLSELEKAIATDLRSI